MPWFVIHFSGTAFFRLRYSYLLLDDLEIDFLLPAWDNRKMLMPEVYAMRNTTTFGSDISNHWAYHNFFFSGYAWIVYTSLKGMLD